MRLILTAVGVLIVLVPWGPAPTLAAATPAERLAWRWFFTLCGLAVILAGWVS